MGTTNKAKEMLLLWEQYTGNVIAVGARHTRCYGNGNMAIWNKVQEMLLLWEQGTGDVIALGARHRRRYCWQ